MSGECDKCGEHALECECIAWYEFLSNNSCSLCANWGFINTRGIKSPAGFSYGILKLNWNDTALTYKKTLDLYFHNGLTYLY